MRPAPGHHPDAAALPKAGHDPAHHQQGTGYTVPPTPGSEPPQVSSDTHSISLLSSDVDKAVHAAVANPRRGRSRPVVTVSAVAIYTTSRRDLPRSIFIARCPECERRRQFNESGRRLCPCGTFLHLVLGAEVG